MYIQKLSKETKEVMAIGKENHWGFRVLGPDEMITSPVYKDEWWYVPLEEDQSIIPEETKRRALTIESSGIKTQGFIVAHEAPKILISTTDKPQPVKTQLIQNLDTLGEAVVYILSGFAAVFGFMLTALPYVLMAPAFLLIDPALIAVLEDGTWVELMRWQE